VYIDGSFATGSYHARTPYLCLGYYRHVANLPSGYRERTHRYRYFTLPCEP